MSRALIVFAKEPVPGMVKTRLKCCLSNEERVRLYKAFVRDTLAIAKHVSCRKKILAFSSNGTPGFLKGIGGGFELIEQKGRTLGDRMYNVFVYAQENKSKKTVIIGTDSPTLSPCVIERAFKELSRKDVVLGPSVDGGYYLIGMKEPCAEIFKGVRWSSRAVMRRTLRNTKDTGKSVALLKQWYDVDDYPGLSRLINHLNAGENKNIALHTRRLLNKRKV